MGAASPYSARFVGLPLCGQSAQTNDSGASLGDAGEKYCGLANLSNTCYVNSVLQALYYCRSFRKCAIQHLNEEKDDALGGETLLTSLAELFVQISNQRRSASYVTPRRFLARLRKANDLFDSSEHQDAHEFMQFLLNDIAESMKKRVQRQREQDKLRQQQLQQQQAAAGAEGGSSASSRLVTSNRDVNQAPAMEGEEEQPGDPRTWVHDIFQGYLVNQMKCLCCENVSVRRETFLDLSVDIERRTSLAACLRAFESTELLRAGNKFFCDRCSCLQEAEKRLRIYQLPSVLTLHLKRFKYVERLGRCCRLPYRVVFPLQLCVVEHRHPRGQDGDAAESGSGRSGAATKLAPKDGVSAVAADGYEPASSTGAEGPPSRLFELRSVVVHIGKDPSRGHYVTVVRHDDRCVLLDDDVVRIVEPEVLRSFYGTAGGDSPEKPYCQSGATHERTQSRSGGGGGNSNGWSVPDGGQDHSSQSASLYERAPEGICCGYLLFYEAVDADTQLGQETGAVIDIGDAAHWISEQRDLDHSDSGGSTADDQLDATVQDRPSLSTCDDGELTQAFEQRCAPRRSASR